MEPKERLNCEVCSETFESSEELQRHEQERHGALVRKRSASNPSSARQNKDEDSAQRKEEETAA